jgi:hypothetical protein
MNNLAKAKKIVEVVKDLRKIKRKLKSGSFEGKDEISNGIEREGLQTKLEKKESELKVIKEENDLVLLCLELLVSLNKKVDELKGNLSYVELAESAHHAVYK